MKVGESVKLEASIEMPPGAGFISAADWDLEGAGDFAAASQLDAKATRARVSTSYIFSKPGTYFPSLRVASHRPADAISPYAKPLNLGRVRVVVT